MKNAKRFVCILILICFFTAGCTPDDSPSSDPADVIQGANQESIFFLAGNDYYDLYCYYSFVPGPEIMLLSRENISEENIHVSLDIQAKYTVSIREQETGASLTTYDIYEKDGTREVTETSANLYAFPLYLYQTYAGMDWDNVGKLYEEYRSAEESHKAGELDIDQVEAALSAYNYAATEYVSEYMELETEDLPTFHKYLIQIAITRAEVEETLKSVQITINDTVYDVNIGEIHIRPDSSDDGSGDYLKTTLSSPLWLNCYPYGSGIEQCQSNTFCAETPVTITGLHFWENTLSTVNVLDVSVVLSDDENSAFLGDGIEIKWDGKTPIYVEQGKFITLFLTVQDDRMKEISYHSKLYPVIEFECNGNSFELASEIPLCRHYTDNWLLYSIGLDGLDMESYFNDYYYVAVSNWRNNISLKTWDGTEK